MNWLRKLTGRAPRKQLTPELRERIRASFNQSAGDEEHFPSTIDPRIFHVKLILEHIGELGTGRVLDRLNNRS